MLWEFDLTVNRIDKAWPNGRGLLWVYTTQRPPNKRPGWGKALSLPPSLSPPPPLSLIEHEESNGDFFFFQVEFKKTIAERTKDQGISRGPSAVLKLHPREERTPDFN